MIVLGRTNRSPLRPVSALLSYLVVRGMAPGPLFIWDNGHFLTRAHFVAEVEKVLELAGADASDFNGHSFRIGVASTGAANGRQANGRLKLVCREPGQEVAQCI